MIGSIRKFLNTRVARLFFIVLIVPFVMWGVADVARNYGQNTALATVGGRAIEPAEFQDAFRQQLTQVTRMMGGKAEPTPEIRKGVAAQTLDRLVVQAAIANEVQQMGLAVPDEALRRSVFTMSAFRGPGGAFDRSRFDAILRQNNLTEGRFLELMRSDLGQRQIIETVQAGVSAPEVLLKQVFAYQNETRVAQTVELPFSAAPEPPAPAAEQLKAAYEDDPNRYSAPAYRRIKAVILSPETLAKGIEVSDADIAAYYQQHQAEFGAPEKRSVEVLVSQDEAAAKTLAGQWSAGADWAAMQKAAAAAGASSAQLDDAAKTDIPAAELADAAFAAEPGKTVGPVKSAFGWQVARVTKVTPGNERPLSAVHDEIRDQIARSRAVDDVYARANKLEDALAAGDSLDSLPADLGVAAITGTLDAQGDTKDGNPAPIPGTQALRQAIVAAAFAAPKGEPPHMTEGPDQSYYALTVEDVTPATVKPYDAVEAEVKENWEADYRRKEQEKVAAKLLTAVNAGGSLADAATIAGLRTEKTPPIARSGATEGVPPQLVPPVFGLKPNEATMVETPEGFIVARLDAIHAPEPSSDPAAAAQMRVALNESMAQDVEMAYAAALRQRAKPTVNRPLFESLVQ